MLAHVDARDDIDVLCCEMIKDRVRESAQERPAYVAVDDWEPERVRSDGVEARIDRAEKVQAETRGVRGIPREGRIHVRLRHWANAKCGHSSEAFR